MSSYCQAVQTVEGTKSYVTVLAVVICQTSGILVNDVPVAPYDNMVDT